MAYKILDLHAGDVAQWVEGMEKIDDESSSDEDQLTLYRILSRLGIFLPLSDALMTSS